MGTEAVKGLTGGETDNPNVSNGLAGFECSPLPAERANLVADPTQFQPHGSPVVSAAGKWVNPDFSSNSPVELGGKGKQQITKK